jgi:hypothetical protein
LGRRPSACSSLFLLVPACHVRMVPSSSRPHSFLPLRCNPLCPTVQRLLDMVSPEEIVQQITSAPFESGVDIEVTIQNSE